MRKLSLKSSTSSETVSTIVDDKPAMSDDWNMSAKLPHRTNTDTDNGHVHKQTDNIVIVFLSFITAVAFNCYSAPGRKDVNKLTELLLYDFAYIT